MREDPYAAVAVNWRRGRQRMSWLDSITDSIGHELGQTLGDSGGIAAVHWGKKNLTRLSE